MDQEHILNSAGNKEIYIFLFFKTWGVLMTLRWSCGGQEGPARVSKVSE